MTSRAELSSPSPFPTRTFVAIGVVWVLTDLTAMAILWSWSFRNPWFQLIAISWQAVLAAKAMLMLGWWFLGEGKFGRRLAGGLLFAPVLAPVLFATIFEPELFCILGGLAALAVPCVCIVGLAFVVLAAMEYRLALDAPIVKLRMGQFTVRQLMVVTLVASLVLGLLRWAHQANMSWAVIGLETPLLVWVYPFALCRGLLQPRWYPEVLFALGVTAYVLALPLFTLTQDDVGPVTLFVGVYALVFTSHLLLLRYLGFRLVQHYRRLRIDEGICFIDPCEPGITFVEGEKNERSATF